jgi:hypothetical protein
MTAPTQLLHELLRVIAPSFLISMEAGGRMRHLHIQGFAVTTFPDQPEGDTGKYVLFICSGKTDAFVA